MKNIINIWKITFYTSTARNQQGSCNNSEFLAVSSVIAWTENDNRSGVDRFLEAASTCDEITTENRTDKENTSYASPPLRNDPMFSGASDQQMTTNVPSSESKSKGAHTSPGLNFLKKTKGIRSFVKNIYSTKLQFMRLHEQIESDLEIYPSIERGKSSQKLY